MELVRCPLCVSTLIYPIDIAGSGCRTVISRRCPECELQDMVVTDQLAASAWLDRNIRLRESLAALCEAIADGIPMCLEDFELSRSDTSTRREEHEP
jgi:hypothetical protein